MSKKALTSQLQDVLIPLGFSRQGVTWRRHSGSLIDVVEADIYSERVSVVAGVLDPEVHKWVWNEEPPDVIKAVECTVYAYVGDLTGVSDWWPLHAESTAQRMAEVVVSAVLPFLDKMHSAEEMEKYIEEEKFGNSVGPWRRFPDWNLLFHLVILKHRRGLSAEACGLLADYRSYLTWLGRLDETFAKRIAELESRLGCERRRPAVSWPGTSGT